LDSAIEEIERASTSTAATSTPTAGQPPFTSKHVVITLQSITMLLSHCLLDRSQLEPLLPFLHEMFEDNDEQVLKPFGLGVQPPSRRKRRTGRSDSEPPGVDLAANANGSSNGPIQLISNIFHNLMVAPISSTGGSGQPSAPGAGGSTGQEVFGSSQTEMT